MVVYSQDFSILVWIPLYLIRTDDGSVTHDPSKKAEIFSIVFQNKQSDQELNLPPTCFLKPKFTYFAFKSSEIKYWLKDLNPHGYMDPHNIFPLFLNMVAVILAIELVKIFGGLIATGSFPAVPFIL